jgi:hypothetical protein
MRPISPWDGAQRTGACAGGSPGKKRNGVSHGADAFSMSPGRVRLPRIPRSGRRPEQHVAAVVARQSRCPGFGLSASTGGLDVTDADLRAAFAFLQLRMKVASKLIADPTAANYRSQRTETGEAAYSPHRTAWPSDAASSPFRGISRRGTANPVVASRGCRLARQRRAADPPPPPAAASLRPGSAVPRVLGRPGWRYRQ